MVQKNSPMVEKLRRDELVVSIKLNVVDPVIAEIAQVPGIDMLFFGPADFAHSLGIPCDLGNEKVTEARKRVAEVARRYGKLAGTVGGTGNMRELYEMGYRLINLGSDVFALGDYFKNIMKQVEDWKGGEL